MIKKRKSKDRTGQVQPDKYVSYVPRASQHKSTSAIISFYTASLRRVALRSHLESNQHLFTDSRISTDYYDTALSPVAVNGGESNEGGGLGYES